MNTRRGFLSAMLKAGAACALVPWAALRGLKLPGHAKPLQFVGTTRFYFLPEHYRAIPILYKGSKA